MKKSNEMHVAIIGNGISGVTAARFIRKLSDHKITLISSETEYFFSRTALMYIYMGHMRKEDTCHMSHGSGLKIESTLSKRM